MDAFVCLDALRDAIAIAKRIGLIRRRDHARRIPKSSFPRRRILLTSAQPNIQRPLWENV